MASLDNNLKHMLERLFGMSTGYVLDFSNDTFTDFIQTSVGFNPYDRYEGSKARVLRQLWQYESTKDVRKLTLEMLERWHTNKLFAGDGISPADQQLYDLAREKVSALSGDAPASPDDLAFIERDFEVDVDKLSVPLSFKQVIEQRLDEIDRCLKARAPLAVIFLCGSTLEGLLAEVAQANPEAFNRCHAAPKGRDGKVRPLPDWTLEALITTAREVGVVGEDVIKHAHAVKDFRNYIHPRQQLKDNFTPRMLTAEIAYKVLQAALADLGGSGPS